MNKKTISISFLLFLLCFIFTVQKNQAATAVDSLNEEVKTLTEVDLVDFKNIKDLLKKDGLDESAKKREDEIKKNANTKISQKNAIYNFPQEDLFWKLFTQYWLVKNAALLEWDFVKPDYGIEAEFAEFLHRLGYFGVRFNVLIINSPSLTHAALPYGDEYLFILSLPFIRTMDLSKMEIALLLFEDFVRIRLGFFSQKVESKELKSFYGKNFKSKKNLPEILTSLEKKYSEVLLNTGFSFDEQFKVTQDVDLLLKKDLSIWNAYLKLITKIKDLVENNTLYAKYGQIYPSPQLQINWLTPKKKDIL